MVYLGLILTIFSTSLAYTKTANEMGDSLLRVSYIDHTWKAVQRILTLY